MVETLSLDEKGSFRNVLNKFQIRGITVLIVLSKSVRLHGDRLRRSHIKFIRDARIGGCGVALGTSAIQNFNCEDFLSGSIS